jgi:hypothetical protein
MKRSFILFLSCVALTSFSQGCASDLDQEEAGETDEELRALRANENLGAIAYGETKTFDYAHSGSGVTYRAYEFTAAAGDEVDVWAKSATGNATLYLVSAAGTTLARNLNATPSTKDANIVRKLSKAGKYFIVVRDAALEAAKFTVSLAKKSAGPTNPTTTGRIVRVADQSFNVAGTEAQLATWGKGVWEGYVSFNSSDLDYYGGRGDPYGSTKARVVDANGASYPLGGRIERIPLPVTFFGQTTGRYSGHVGLSAIYYEITRTNSIPAASLAGRFPDAVSIVALRTFGEEVPGATLSFKASASFFSNFTNGVGCTRIYLEGASGSEFLSDSESTKTVQLVAPVTVNLYRTCLSARLASPANTTKDASVSIAAITVGDPI